MSAIPKRAIRKARRPLSDQDAAYVERWSIPESAIPNVDDIVIDDGAPVDGFFSEKNMRLLTESLYTSWKGPGDGRPFAVLANVGYFHSLREPPIVPDVMLSLDVEYPRDRWMEKEHQSYFLWVRGKTPEVAIEIVSNREGEEEGQKKAKYARYGFRYYVIYDPFQLLSRKKLRCFELRGKGYEPLRNGWLEDVGLGLTIWNGTYERATADFLRWRDAEGVLLPTGAEATVAKAELMETEKQRADLEKQRADLEKQRADAEKQRAETEKARADAAVEEVARLRRLLKDRGTKS